MKKDKNAEFVDNLVKTVALLDLAYTKFYKKYDVTRAQFLALYFILQDAGTGITLSQLGDELGVSRANITTLVDRMEVSGLVKRCPDSTDRRSIRVIAQEKGRKVLEKVLPDRIDFAEEIFGSLNETDLEKGNELVFKIQAAIKKQINTDF